MNTKTQTPIRQLPADYPHDSCDWPDDMVHASMPSQMKARLEARGHTVTRDGNDLYDEVRHGVLPVTVRYFKPAHDQPWRITDRARILRALKLFAFFCLGMGVAAAVLFWRQLEAFAASHIL